MSAASRKMVSLGGRRRIPALPLGSLDATPERLRHALNEGDARIEGVARRLADPFDTLAGRQRLDHASVGDNDVLWQAGLRFRRHWYGAQLDGLKAFDFSRESVDGGLGAQDRTTPTEAAIRHRASYRAAAAAVGDRLLPFLSGIVIEARPAGALSPLISETAHARTAEALVIERLREALHRLVQHWGMVAGPTARRSKRDHLAGVQDV